MIDDMHDDGVLMLACPFIGSVMPLCTDGSFLREGQSDSQPVIDVENGIVYQSIFVEPHQLRYHDQVTLGHTSSTGYSGRHGWTCIDGFHMHAYHWSCPVRRCLEGKLP